MSLLASRRIRVTTVVLAVAAFLVSVSARAEKRVALVIGNAAYTELSVLQNPINDATEMETSLRQLGFQVLSLKNARKADVENAIRRFGELVHGADVAVFFYSGHGFQTSRANQHHPVNHLVPVDYREPTGAVLDTTVPLDGVLTALDLARVSLVFMDACRSDPTLTQTSRRFGARSVGGIPRGFVPVETGAVARDVSAPAASDSRASGMLIAYAAAPGKEALDGDDRVSPFTKSLVKHIRAPGVPISDTMGKVGLDVLHETANRQVPWVVSRLTAPFYLVPPTRRPSGTMILP